MAAPVFRYLYILVDFPVVCLASFIVSFSRVSRVPGGGGGGGVETERDTRPFFLSLRRVKKHVLLLVDLCRCACGGRMLVQNFIQESINLLAATYIFIQRYCSLMMQNRR